MIYFWGILFILLILYCILIVSYSIAFGKQKLFISTNSDNSSPIKISVIIALRNEEKNVGNLINALKEQNLPSSSFEAILVNDHSTDNTYEKLKRLTGNYPWVNVYELEKEKYGKKEALQFGILKAKGELLAFTDGDCIPLKTWLSSLAEFYFSENKPDFIIGLVDQNAKNVLQQLFRIEFLSLVLTSSGAAISGHPVLCNGANLGIKTSVIKSFSHNTEITSGDDVFLLHHLKKQKKTIRVLKSREHLVMTKAPKNISSFLEQRKRWASKTRYYNDKDTILLALLVFAINAALIFSVPISINSNKFSLLGGALGIKFLTDLLLFHKGKEIYNYNRQLWLLPFLAITYPFYIVITSLIALKRPFAWKGRKYSK